MHVGKPLTASYFLLSSGDLILERNSLNHNEHGKVSTHGSTSAQRVTTHMDRINTGKPEKGFYLLANPRKFTEERNLIMKNDDFKKSPQPLFAHYKHGRTHTGEKPLLIIHILKGTRDTVEENCMKANTVK